MSPTGPPTFIAKDGAATDTGVISPGHTFRWKYCLPKGKYFSACFWPSKVDGTPHAFMGMFERVRPALSLHRGTMPSRSWLSRSRTGVLVHGLGALAGQLPGLSLGQRVLVGALVVAPEVVQPHRRSARPRRRSETPPLTIDPRTVQRSATKPARTWPASGPIE